MAGPDVTKWGSVGTPVLRSDSQMLDRSHEYPSPVSFDPTYSRRSEQLLSPLRFSSSLRVPTFETNGSRLEFAMRCNVRASLFSTYDLRIEEYQWTVDRLKAAQVRYADDYVRLLDRADRAMKACDLAKKQIEHHVRMHQCFFEAEDSSTLRIA